MKELLGDYETFVAEISDGLRRCGIGRDEIAMMDHICYRVETIERYDQMKARLAKSAFLLGESMVSGRLIATFECEEPLKVDGWTIPYIELPQPKSGSDYSEGLEHVEFVLFDTFETFLEKYSTHNFDLKAMHRGINPEIALSLGRYSVKFHLLGLLTVVYLEHKLGVEKVSD